MSELVGIVNVTPDSFSDGGTSYTPEDAIKHIQALVAQGADVIDIGAESTRPGATPITASEEWQRLQPLWKDAWDYCKAHNILLSLDTRHASTAAKALDIGCDWINDVSGFADSTMRDVVKSADCKLVIMHSLSIPADPSVIVKDALDIVTEVQSFFAERMAELGDAGVDDNRFILDPGIGFGKSAQQSLDILWHIAELQALDYPMLIGHSRKSCFKLCGGDWEVTRDALTLLMSHFLMDTGVEYLRVHDVYAHRALQQ